MKRAVLALIMSAAVAGLARAQPLDAQHNWRVRCDNTRVCVAIGYSPEEGEANQAYLRVENAPMTRLESVLSAEALDSDPAHPVWTVAIDGHPVPGVGALHPRRSDQRWRASLSSPQTSILQAAAMRGGHGLSIMRGDQAVATVSLDGAARAFRMMFATTRDRTPPAPRVAHQVLPAQTALPSLRAPAPTAVVRLREDCEDQQMQGNRPRGVWRMGPDLLLWQLPCSGGYNDLDLFVLSDNHGGHARAVSFPNPGAEQPTPEPFNASFDPHTGVLSDIEYGRGLGDCGTASEWVWTGGGFALLRQRALEECRGVLAVDWPVVWRGRLH